MRTVAEKSMDRPLKGIAKGYTTFREQHESVFADFAEGLSPRVVSEKYGVSYQIGCMWRRHWLAIIDFTDDPPKIVAMKKEAATQIGSHTATGIIDSKYKRQAFALRVADINAMRLKGLNIIDLGMDRILELIAKEKSVKSIASVLSAILPYVAVRRDAMGDRGTPLDVKKATFIQNVMNVYNNPQKAIPNETIEDIEPEWDPEE